MITNRPNIYPPPTLPFSVSETTLLQGRGAKFGHKIGKMENGMVGDIIGMSGII